MIQELIITYTDNLQVLTILMNYFHISISPNHFDEDDPYCRLLPWLFWSRSFIRYVLVDIFPNPIFGIYPAGGAFDEDKGGYTLIAT